MRVAKLATLALIVAAASHASPEGLAALDAEFSALEARVEAMTMKDAQKVINDVVASTKAAATKMKAMDAATKGTPGFRATALKGQALFKAMQEKAKTLNGQAKGGVTADANKALMDWDKDFREVFGRFKQTQIKDLATQEAKFDADMKRLETGFAGLDAKHPSYKAVKGNWEMLQGYYETAKAKLPDYRKKLEAAKAAEDDKLEFKDDYHMKRWVKEYKRQLPRFTTIDLVALQDPKNEESLRYSINKLRDMLGKISRQDHPRVTAAMAQVKDLEAGLERVLKERDEVSKKAGDVDGQLALLKDNFSRDNFQPELKEPYTVDKLSTWGENHKEWRALHGEGVKFLDKAKQYSLKARTSQFDAYHRWFKLDVKRRMEKAMSEGVTAMTRRIETSLRSWKLSEQNLSQERFVKQVVDDMDEAIEVTRAMEAFEEAFSGEIDERWARDRTTLEVKRAQALGGAEEALKNARMPSPKSTDPELLAVAAKELKDPKHGFGPARRIVINNPLQHYKQVVWHREGFSLRKWKQFQVTFAEQDPEDASKFWIHYAILKFIEEGAPGDIIGRWYITGKGTFRSKQILEENIDK